MSSRTPAHHKAPAAAPPQYSPDGNWWWNGAYWQPMAEPEPGGLCRLPVWGWVGIGCGALLVLAVGFAVVSILTFRSLAGAQCPPANFPRPAGAVQKTWHIFAGAGSATCDVGWTVDEPAERASQFYATALDRGAWRVTAIDSLTGAVSFERTNDAGVTGQLELLGHGQQTDVLVHLTSKNGRFDR